MYTAIQATWAEGSISHRHHSHFFVIAVIKRILSGPSMYKNGTRTSGTQVLNLTSTGIATVNYAVRTYPQGRKGSTGTCVHAFIVGNSDSVFVRVLTFTTSSTARAL